MASAIPIHPGLFTVPDDPRGPALIAGRCPECWHYHFPAAPTCPYCASDGCAQAAIGKTARLYLYTVVNARPPGYSGPVPYGFGVVELPEGLRVLSRIEETDPGAIARGAEMELVIAPLFRNDAAEDVLTWSYRVRGRTP